MTTLALVKCLCSRQVFAVTTVITSIMVSAEMSMAQAQVQVQTVGMCTGRIPCNGSKQLVYLGSLYASGFSSDIVWVILSLIYWCYCLSVRTKASVWMYLQILTLKYLEIFDLNFIFSTVHIYLCSLLDIQWETIHYENIRILCHNI